MLLSMEIPLSDSTQPNTWGPLCASCGPLRTPPVPYLSLWGCSCALALHCHMRTPPYSPFGLLGTPPCPIPMLLFEDPLCALSVPLGTPLCSSFMLPFGDNPLPHLHAAF